MRSSIVLAGAIAVGLGACGGGGDDAPSVVAARMVVVNDDTMQIGYRCQFETDGFVFDETETISIEVRNESDGVAVVSVFDEVPNRVDDIRADPGETVVDDFDLDSGAYGLACTVNDLLDEGATIAGSQFGQAATFTVNPAG